jgi:hypothetical protein
LLEPLVREFGAPRVFAYAARTPFRIENNNVRLSALRYQDGAREAIALRPASNGRPSTSSAPIEAANR